MEGDHHGQKKGTKRRRVRQRLQEELAGAGISSDEDSGGTGPRAPPGARGLDGLAASPAQLGSAMATGLGQLAGAFAGRGGRGTCSALSAESLKLCASDDGGAGHERSGRVRSTLHRSQAVVLCLIPAAKTPMNR